MINIWNFGRFISSVDMTVNPIAWWIALGLIFFAQYSNFILYETFRRYPCYFPFRLTVEWGTVGTVLNWGIKCSSNSFFGAHNGLVRIYTSWGVYGALNFRFSNFYWHFLKLEGKECSNVWRGTLYMPAYIIYIWYTGNTLWSCCFMMGHLSGNLFLICIDTLYCFLDVKFDRLSDSHSLSLSISLFHDMSIRCLTLHMMWVHHCFFPDLLYRDIAQAFHAMEKNKWSRKLKKWTSVT